MPLFCVACVQAALARSEVARLEAVVRLLSERLAKSEASAAAAEVARRLAISGSGPQPAPRVGDNGAFLTSNTEAPAAPSGSLFGSRISAVPLIAATVFLLLAAWKVRL